MLKVFRSHQTSNRITKITNSQNSFWTRRFQNENFEHQHHIEQRPTGVGLVFFLANQGERLAKNLPIDKRIELGQEVVDLINLVKLVFNIEKRILPSDFAQDRTLKS